jgi:hypothetical protein
MRRRQRPGRIELQQPRNQHRPGHPRPRRDLTPRAQLPHPTPFRSRRPIPTTVPRSQDSGAQWGVPAPWQPHPLQIPPHGSDAALHERPNRRNTLV